MCRYGVNCTILVVFIGAKIFNEEDLQLRRTFRQKRGKKRRRRHESKRPGVLDAPLHWLVSSKKDENRVDTQVRLEVIESIISLLLHVRGCAESLEGGTWCISFLLLPLSFQMPQSMPLPPTPPQHPAAPHPHPASTQSLHDCSCSCKFSRSGTSRLQPFGRSWSPWHLS